MAKKLVFYVITFGLLFSLFEIIGYLTYIIEDDIYDNRKEVLEKIEENSLTEMKTETLDSVVGWKHRGPNSVHFNNCQGSSVEYSIDRVGARIYSGYNGVAAEIIVTGDSYSLGFEVNADESFPAQLAEILGVLVANHAVAGYGPVQAFLNLQQNIHHYPKAKIVILGIMYENIFRMVNSYRPVLTRKSPVYQIKPYMNQGVIKPHPGQNVFKDIGSFKEYVEKAFDNDFWAKSKHTFPFSVAFVKALASNFFYYKKLPRKLRKMGFPEYFLAYPSEDFSHELLSLLDRYATFAEEREVIAMVVFIPRDKYDRQSVAKFIEKNDERLRKDLIVGDVGTIDIDWDKYNLLDSSDADNIRFCHPSPFGQRKIAEYVAGLLSIAGVYSLPRSWQ